MMRIMHNASRNASAFCTIYPPSVIFMSDSAKRLREARERSGYSSAKAAAEAMKGITGKRLTYNPANRQGLVSN